MGRLAFGPNPLGVPGRRVGRAFLGRLASGPNPFRALGLGRLARGAGPGPKVPTKYMICDIIFLQYLTLIRDVTIQIYSLKSYLTFSFILGNKKNYLLYIYMLNL